MPSSRETRLRLRADTKGLCKYIHNFGCHISSYGIRVWKNVISYSRICNHRCKFCVGIIGYALKLLTPAVEREFDLSVSCIIRQVLAASTDLDSIDANQ